MYSEQTQLDQVAQGCVQLNLSVSEDADLMDSLGFCSSMWQPSWRRLFPFFLKICLEFSMLQLGNPFEQRSEGTPSLQDLLLNFAFFFFPSGNSASSSIELTDIKGVHWTGKKPKKDK